MGHFEIHLHFSPRVGVIRPIRRDTPPSPNKSIFSIQKRRQLTQESFNVLMGLCVPNFTFYRRDFVRAISLSGLPGVLTILPLLLFHGNASLVKFPPESDRILL